MLRLSPDIGYCLSFPRFPCRLRLSFAFGLIAMATAFAAEPTTKLPAVPNPRLTGTPFLSTWDSDDHGGAPSNYHVVQHPQTGFIYVGNTFGLIEYDGASWRLIPFRNDGVVPIVVIDRKGAVWLGGSNEIAVLRPDSKGELQPVDVTERLPAAERDFGRLYVGAAAPEGVYLASPTRLLFFGEDGTARSWESGPNRFNGLFWLDGALHASKGSGGLMRLENGAFQAVANAPRSPNPAVADTLRVFRARPASDGAGAIFLTNIGPMRWSGPGAPIEPLAVAGLAEFARESATTAAFLPDGRFAFSFQRSGLLFMDANGAVSARLDPAPGSFRGPIEHIATDNQGGLWLARGNGIARLQIDSRFATQGEFHGARAFLRHGKRLYASYHGGVGWRDKPTGPLNPVAGLPNSPSSLFSVGDRVFGTGQFLREITAENRAVVALGLSFNSVTPLHRVPGKFVGATITGLRLLHFDGSAWRDEGLLPGVRGGVRHALEDREGWLWVQGYDGSGSWRVDFRGGARLDAPVDYFDGGRGLPFSRRLDPERFFSLGGETLATRAGALLRFDRTAGRFVAEDRIENAPVLGPIATTPGSDGEQWWFINTPTPQLAHVIPSGENRWRAEFLSAAPMQGFLPDLLHYDAPTRTLWMGGKGAPVTVDPAWRPSQPPPPLHARVRRLTAASGELLWASSGLETLETEPATLDSRQNSLRFTFAVPAFTPDFRGASRTFYRTRLDGLEEDWSAWSPTPWREFSHLPYRNFVFRVQARDIEGRESSIGTLAFAIAPPWWRTWWFIGMGSAAGLGAVVGASRWLAIRALKRRLQLLEAQSAVERERLRLARDLHDEVGSGLGRVILFADEAERVTAEPEKLRASLSRVRNSAQELVQHTREIVWAVSPQHDTLASVIERFGNYTVETLHAAGIACALDRPEPKNIPPIVLGSEARHSLFLAVKEAVHNCVKYSEAKTAEFRLAISGEDFVIELRDHGRGFVEGQIRGSGYGTVSIIARAKVLGGRAEISSEVGKGTTVLVRVPLKGPAK